MPTQTYGKYFLCVDFEKLTEQRALLKLLAGLLNFRDRDLLKGLCDLLDSIELQETRSDTSVTDECVKQLTSQGILSSQKLPSRKA